MYEKEDSGIRPDKEHCAFERLCNFIPIMHGVGPIKDNNSQNCCLLHNSLTIMTTTSFYYYH